MRELDLRNKSCPIPLVETRKFINENRDVDFNIILDNELSFLNIKRYLENNKINYSSNKSGDNYIFEVIFDGNERLSNKKFQINNFCVLVMSDLFGVGDESLSRALMKSYFYALNNSITLPSNIIFMNSGVKLLVEDSGIIDSIQSLKDKGSSILACGTCIDFYKINEKIKVAEVTNMHLIVEILSNSDNVVKI